MPSSKELGGICYFMEPQLYVYYNEKPSYKSNHISTTFCSIHFYFISLDKFNSNFYPMKKITLFPLVFVSCLLFGQTDPNIIDFEPGPLTCNLSGDTYNPQEGNQLDNDYFSCVYGVTFHVGTLDGPPPIIAKVGPPRVAFSNYSQNTYSCGKELVSANDDEDKPAAATANLIGCYFITDDTLVASSPPSLFIKYERPCSQASGRLLDVDLRERWRVSAYTHNNSNAVDFQDLHPTSPDGSASHWQLDLNGEAINYIEIKYTGNITSAVGLGFDYFSTCEEVALQDSSRCCNGFNLIPNGDFEYGNPFFSSEYDFQSTIEANSIKPGEYAVLNNTEALTVSPQWNVFDQSNCNPTGHFLAVNGRTSTSSSSIIYNSPSINVDPNEEYVFCMYYQLMEQCAFEAFDPENLNISINGANTTQNSMCGNDQEIIECGWNKLSWTVTPTSNQIDISISLDESDLGDGNDLAFDNFSLQKKLTLPDSWVDFNTYHASNGNGSYTLTAFSLGALSDDFDVKWTVSELDCETDNSIPGKTMSSPDWDDNVTNFPGYCCTSPTSIRGGGTFYEDRCYTITRSVSNCCYKSNEKSYDFYYSKGILRMLDKSTGLWSEVPIGNDSQKRLETQESLFRIKPNPGDGNVEISIHADSQLKNPQIRVYSMDGRLFQEVTEIGNKTNFNLDISSLNKGIYIIKLVDQGNIIRAEKYIKQ